VGAEQLGQRRRAGDDAGYALVAVLEGAFLAQATVCGAKTRTLLLSWAFAG
jgi:hypothetical protein